jgi:hypothetical protein
MFIKHGTGIITAIIEEEKLTDVQKATAQLLTDEAVRVVDQDTNKTSDNEKKLEN